MSRRNTELLLLIASAFPVILLYAMYVLTAGAAISFETLAVPIGLFAAFAAAHIAVRILAPGADPAILPIVFILSGIGITFVTRLAPALAISQLIILFVSVALMVGTLALVKNLDVVMRYKYTFGIIGIILLMLPIFIGTTISGSKLWIRIAGFTIQPGEFAKVFIVLFLAGYLAENRELLSISNRKILGFKIPAVVCRVGCVPARRRLRTRPGFGRAVLHHLLADALRCHGALFVCRYRPCALSRWSRGRLQVPVARSGAFPGLGRSV